MAFGSSLDEQITDSLKTACGKLDETIFPADRPGLAAAIWHLDEVSQPN